MNFKGHMQASWELSFFSMFSHSQPKSATHWWLENFPAPYEYPITQWPHLRLATAVLWFRHILAWHSKDLHYSSCIRINDPIHHSKGKFLSLINNEMLCMVQIPRSFPLRAAYIVSAILLLPDSLLSSKILGFSFVALFPRASNKQPCYWSC